jgi:hypothetical protein
MALLYTKRRPFKSIANVSNSGRMADELNPTGNGWLNVVNDFTWTLSKTNAALRETPFIQLNEYYMLQSALNQQLLPYGIDTSSIYSGGQSGAAALATIAGSMFDADTIKLYDGIFDLTNPTGFKYRFPLFTPQQFSANNTWERKDILDTVINFQKMGLGIASKFIGGAGSVPGIGKAATAVIGGAETALNAMQSVPDIIKQITLLKLQMNNPGVGLSDPPQLFQGAAPREYNFTFSLYNTEATNDTQDNVEKTIKRNWELCYILTYQNLFNKRNFFTNTPPVFYEVYIPGVHYCKASVMKNINILNVGNVRVMNLDIDGGPKAPVNVPDAYRIEITMQDVLMPSKNLLESIIDARYQNIVRNQ